MGSVCLIDNLCFDFCRQSWIRNFPYLKMVRLEIIAFWGVGLGFWVLCVVLWSSNFYFSSVSASSLIAQDCTGPSHGKLFNSCGRGIVCLLLFFFFSSLPSLLFCMILSLFSVIMQSAQLGCSEFCMFWKNPNLSIDYNNNISLEQTLIRIQKCNSSVVAVWKLERE